MKKRSKVYTLKLVNGDDIVVNVLSKTIGGSWTVKDAIVMHQVPAGEGKCKLLCYHSYHIVLLVKALKFLIVTSSHARSRRKKF